MEIFCLENAWNRNKHQSPSTRASTAKEFVACLGAKDLQLDCAALGGDWELAEGFMMGNVALCSCCHGKAPVRHRSCRAAEELQLHFSARCFPGNFSEG